MEQLNNELPGIQEENQTTAENPVKKDFVKENPRKEGSRLLIKVRQNFGIFGGISFLFGITFTLSFYKAGAGVNVFLFTFMMVLLLQMVMKKLSVPIKNYVGSILLGISTTLTSSSTLQFLNVAGILILLDLSLLHQFNEDERWDFTRYFGRMAGLLLDVISTIGMPFKDCFLFLKSRKFFKNEKFINILTGIGIAIPLLWVIIGLLSRADLLFGKMTNQIYHSIFSSNIFVIILMVIFGTGVCYCIICGAALKGGEEKTDHERKKASASIGITVLVLLAFVYIIFCSVQVLYLFNQGIFVLPQEFTYAEYARRGFFELLAVTVINIILMLLCTSYFEDSKLIRILLTVITACTYIMMVSAAYRMILYISVYHLTFLRLFVLLFLFIDALVLGGVIVSVYRKKFPLFSYCVGVTVVCYLLFSLAKPDYFIAKYYLEEKENQEMEDTDFLYLTENLSLDAAPALVPYFSQQYPDIKINENETFTDYDSCRDGYDREDAVRSYYERIIVQKNNHKLRDYNLSYSLAKRSLIK